MTNPEMSPRESEEKTPREETSELENIEEKEQTPEEVLAVINEAIKKGRQVLLTQENSEGVVINTAIPYSIEGGFLTIEANGYGFDIKIDSIKKAELF
ncbi:MAG: hypothetical protein AAB361_03510 [Patescibacteria group bacterium]